MICAGESSQGEPPPAAGAEAAAAAEFEAQARAALAEKISGLSVLDVSPDNILNFGQGQFSLVEGDLSAVLEQASAERVLAAVRKVGVEDALAVRRECINFKKVCLNIYQEALYIEKDLKQMVTFFRKDHVLHPGGYFVHGLRYTELCDNLMRCKGALAATHEFRKLTKRICCLPRYPSPAPSKLKDAEGAPDLVRSYIEPARREVMRQREEAGLASRDGDVPGGGAAAAAAAGEGGEGVEEFIWEGSARELRSELTAQGEPPHVADFAEKVLIARGGAKALAIRAERSIAYDALARTIGRAQAAHAAVLALAPPRGGGAPELHPALEALRISGGGGGGGGGDAAGAEGECGGGGGGGARLAEDGSEGAEDGESPEAREARITNAVRARMHQNLLGGCLEALENLHLWLGAIGARAPGERMFLAGDKDRAAKTAMFVPTGFTVPALFRRHREVARRYKPEMRACLRDEGWPPNAVEEKKEEAPAAVEEKKEEAPAAAVPPSAPAPSDGAAAGGAGDGAAGGVEGGGAGGGGGGAGDGAAGGVEGGGADGGGGGGGEGEGEGEKKKYVRKHFPPPQKGGQNDAYTCRECGLRFISTLWVHRGVCCACEESLREDGRCPFNPRCSKTGFCPHDGKCFVCDAWSCEACRLTRGNGEDVSGMVENLMPAAIFLDFDRTLATTRTGGNPMVGNHAVDPDLMALSHTHEVHIVTRNSYRDDIVRFMAAKGLAGTVRVHTVKKHQSKADVIRAGEGERPKGSKVLFVDDSIQEHTDQRMQEVPGLHRVLFVRDR